MDMKYEPFKEIIVVERNLFPSTEELARFASITAGGHTVGLYWADEVVFLNFPIPASTETMAKALVENGRGYWAFVGYAIMKNFQPMIETKEKIMIPVINMSSNATFKKVAQWLKNECYPIDKP